EGVKKYAAVACTVVDGVPEMTGAVLVGGAGVGVGVGVGVGIGVGVGVGVGAGEGAAATRTAKAGSEAVSLPSDTEITIAAVVPTSVAAGVPEIRPFWRSRFAQAG